MTPAQAHAVIRSELKAALADTPLRLAEGVPFRDVEPRTVVAGPPAFSWRGLCAPDDVDLAEFQVWLIDRADERAIESLLESLPSLIAAVQSIGDDCTIVDGPRPTAYPVGSTDLPAYVMTVELGL